MVLLLDRISTGRAIASLTRVTLGCRGARSIDLCQAIDVISPRNKPEFRDLLDLVFPIQINWQGSETRAGHATHRRTEIESARIEYVKYRTLRMPANPRIPV
jgi:hypothetical protein